LLRQNYSGITFIPAGARPDAKALEKIIKTSIKNKIVN